MKKTILIAGAALNIVLLFGIFWLLLDARAARISNEHAARQAAEIAAQRQEQIEDEAAKAELPETLKEIYDAESAGLIDSNRAEYLRDIATGKIKLYRRADGSITTNAFEIPVPASR